MRCVRRVLVSMLVLILDPSQVWGFEEIQGERHYARHIKFSEKPGGKVVYARLVYDYCA
jgi:hypothetical protein